MGNASYFLYSIGNATVDLKKLKKETIEAISIDMEQIKEEEDGIFVHFFLIKYIEDVESYPVHKLMKLLSGYKLQGYWYAEQTDAIADINSRMAINDSTTIQLDEPEYPYNTPQIEGVMKAIGKTNEWQVKGFTAFFECDWDELFYLNLPGPNKNPTTAGGVNYSKLSVTLMEKEALAEHAKLSTKQVKAKSPNKKAKIEVAAPSSTSEHILKLFQTTSFWNQFKREYREDSEAEEEEEGKEEEDYDEFKRTVQGLIYRIKMHCYPNEMNFEAPKTLESLDDFKKTYESLPPQMQMFFLQQAMQSRQF